MSSPAQAVIAFFGQNFDTSGSLVGRQAASAGFLRAYLRHGGADHYSCLTTQTSEIDGFRAFCAAHAPAGRRAEGILPPDMPRLAAVGTLFRPGPDLGYFAWLRRSLGQRAFSICGVNHTLSDDLAVQSFGRLLTGPLQSWDALVCASTSSRDAILRVLDEYSAYFAQRTGAELRSEVRLPIIPLGVDCDEFSPPEGAAAARATERARLGIGAEEFVLLYVGRLNHLEKANPLAMYLAAEQAALRTGRKLRLIQAGWFASEATEQAFRQGAQVLAPSIAHLFLDGRLAENRRVWFAADAFISLVDNFQESFGLTPIEAMAAGLPVVVSDWDGYRDTVRDGIDGFRIATATLPPGLGEAIAFLYAAGYGGHAGLVGVASQSTSVHPALAANAIVKLIEDEALRARMGEAGRARARETYDWPIIVRAHQALWAELAELRRSAPEVAPPQPGRATRPLAMDPFALFRDFATLALGAQVRLSLTPGVDARIAQGMARLALAAPLRGFLLDDAGIARLVEHLAKGPAELHALVEPFDASLRQPAWFTLGWLAKCGLVNWG